MQTRRIRTGSGKTHTIFGSILAVPQMLRLLNVSSLMFVWFPFRGRSEPGLLELFVRRFFDAAPAKAALFAGCGSTLEEVQNAWKIV